VQRRVSAEGIVPGEEDLLTEVLCSGRLCTNQDGSLLKCKNLIELTAKESTLRGNDCVYIEIGNIGSSIMSEDVQGPGVPKGVACLAASVDVTRLADLASLERPYRFVKNKI